MKINYLRKASKLDTMLAWKNKVKVPTQIVDLVTDDLDVGNDVVATDVVMDEIMAAKIVSVNFNIKALEEKKALTLENKVKLKDLRKLSSELSSKLVSCTLSARFGGYPGEHSIWSVKE